MRFGVLGIIRLRTIRIFSLSHFGSANELLVVRRFAQPLQQLCWIQSKCICQANDIDEGNVPLTALCPANVSPIKAGPRSQSLLGEASTLPISP